MKHFLLKGVHPNEDCDFLNETSIEFSFRDKNPNDSGWRDYETGCRILCETDQIIFVAESKEDELVLLLKFGDRLKHD